MEEETVKKKQGRPPNEEEVAIVTLNITKVQKEWLSTMRDIHGVETSALVRRLLNDYIKKVDEALKEISL